MKMTGIKKHLRTTVRVMTFALALTAVLAGFIIREAHAAGVYRIQLENAYQHSLDELCTSTQNINLALEKSLYATTSEQMSAISSEILKNATVAKSSLSELPSSDEALDSLNRFFSQVGEYAVSVSENLIAGRKITDADRENLLALYRSSQKTADGINDLTALYADGGMWTREAENLLEKAAPESDFGGAVFELEDTFTDYPSLIYDGPFSDHILKTSPRMLEGREEVSPDEARRIAADFLGLEIGNIERGNDGAGKIECYSFYNSDSSVSVSKKGGFVIYFRKFRDVGSPAVSVERMMEEARKLLGKFQGVSFRESYYFIDEGVCTINFAYVQNGTTCYTDLVKVGIAVDNGEPVLFEATGYLMNHTDREIGAPKHTVEEARAVLSDKLSVISTDDVLIPSPGSLNEFRCYEFYCKGMDDRELLVYVDAETLAERDILIVLRTDGGTMTK